MTVAEYIRQVADESKKLVVADLRQLAGLSRSQAAEFLLNWSAVPTGRRRQVVQAALDLCEDNVELDFGGLFRACLRDSDDSVRSRAAEGLWEDEDPNSADLLLGLLANDPAEEVRVAAATSLAHVAYRAETGDVSSRLADRVRRGLLAKVQDEREARDVRRRVLESVAYFSGEEITELIRRAYADPDEKMRSSAVFAMGRNCDSAWLDTIIREMRSAIPERRFEAARAAGEIEDQRAIRPLVPLLADTDHEVRLAAIAALGLIGGETARKALQYTVETATESGDDETREAATEAIEEMSFIDDPLAGATGLPDRAGGARTGVESEDEVDDEDEEDYEGDDEESEGDSLDDDSRALDDEPPSHHHD